MHPDPNDPVEAWPLEAGEPGREVWYSLVSPRDAPVAFWYRYTLLSTEAGYQEGRLWAALTDREEPENSTFASAAFPFEEVWPESDPFELTVGDAVLTSSSATGSVGDVTWDLEYEPDSYAFTPLRSETLTDLLSVLVGTGKHWTHVHVSGGLFEETVCPWWPGASSNATVRSPTVTSPVIATDWLRLQCLPVPTRTDSRSVSVSLRSGVNA